MRRSGCALEPPDRPAAGAAPTCPLCGRPGRLLHAPTWSASSSSATDRFACTNPHAGEHGPIHWCAGCRVGFAPAAEYAEIAHRYAAVEDVAYLEEEAHRRAHAARVLDFVERLHRPGQLLEIGSAVGILLDVATRRGWTARGVEPSRWAVETGRRRYGVDLAQGTLEDADYPPGSIDALVMIDVLEHLVDPLAALAHCRPWLATDGVLILLTVNMATPIARVLGTRWPGFMDMHLTYFTPPSLREMLRRAGFAWAADQPSIRSYQLGYVGGRLRHSGGALRWLGRAACLPGLRRVPVTLRTRDLLLVAGRPV